MKTSQNPAISISRVLHQPVNSTFALAAVFITGVLALVAIRFAPGTREIEERQYVNSASRGASRFALPPPPQPNMIGTDNLGRPASVGEYYIGVYVEPADPALVAQLKIEGGIVVRHVVPGSPAETAGVKPNDIMLRAGDSPLLVVCSLGAEVNKIGAKELPFSLLREGQQLSLAMTPTKRPAEIWIPPGVTQMGMTPSGSEVASIGESADLNSKPPPPSGNVDAGRAKLEELERQLAAAQKEVETLKAELAAKKLP